MNNIPGEDILGIKYFKDENRAREQRVKAYRQILSNIYEMNQLGELSTCIVVDDIITEPMEPNFEDENNPAVNNMLKHNAKWHKSCRNLIDNQKVQRARAKFKKKSLPLHTPSPVKTRQTSDDSILSPAIFPSP